MVKIWSRQLKVTWGAHAGSWRVNVFHDSSCELAKSRWPTRCTDSWDFKCDSYTIYSYYIYPHYPQICKEAIQKKTLERGSYNTHHFRESYSSSRENSFVVSSPFSFTLLYIERRFLPKHNPHLFRVYRVFWSLRSIMYLPKQVGETWQCNRVVLQDPGS